MCLLNLFKPKAKKEAAPKKEKPEKSKVISGARFGKRNLPKSPEPDIPDEEYLLPSLSIGNFSMNEELRRRQQAEQLRKKYGIREEKEGVFV